MAEHAGAGNGAAGGVVARCDDGPATNKRTWRDVLKLHAAADSFPMMSEDELKALGEDIRRNGLRSPLALWEESKGGGLWLLDGRNRLDAMEAVGLPVLDKAGRWLARDIDCRTTRYRNDDPYVIAASLNLHRRHMTALQKCESIANLLKADPTKSDRQVADAIKVSPTTVGTVRAKLEAAGAVSKLDTRTDAKGRKQPAKKKKRARVEKHECAQCHNSGPATIMQRRPSPDHDGHIWLHDVCVGDFDEAMEAEPKPPESTRLDQKKAEIAEQSEFVTARWQRTDDIAAIAQAISAALKYEPHTEDITPLVAALETCIGLALPADGSIPTFLRRAT